MGVAVQRWGPWRSLLALAPILICSPLLAYHHLTNLPKPLSALTDPVTKLPQISEERILGVARHLSEDIGYRTVGTYEHAVADEWMMRAAEQVKNNCDRIVRSQGRHLECEVWHQRGSGTHRFDMMGKRLYKNYVDLTNIVVRVSNGTDAGKEHAVLVNAHVDSTLPSPGAADDAISVGIMLDCMRVLIETPDWSPKHSIIFLFNNAEESLQDGSHLFSTQHPIAPTVRAVINLEAAGTTGKELLFQATSSQMIHAYSHVPRPYGTIFANDIFSSGIILSDTDFRQFEEYINVTGLDIAIVGNSYLYHMRKDLVENIEPGVAQHMGENTLALLRHMSGEESPLPSLTEGYTPPTTVFFGHVFNTFFMYSFSTAKKMYASLLVASFALVRATFVDPAPALKRSTSKAFWAEMRRGSTAVVAGTLGTIFIPNLVGVVMRDVLGKGMSWFRAPTLPIGLFGPAALFGALLSQYLVGRVHERSVYNALLLLQSSMALGLQFLGVGSAALFFLCALPLFGALALNRVFAAKGSKYLSLVTYGIGQLLPLVTGSLLLIGTLDVFVPLTGRMGAQAPADNIVATLISILGAQALPLVLPFSHRFGHRALSKGVLFMSVVTAMLMAVYSSQQPFDDMHQKRLFVLHLENVTSHEHHLHLAAADGAPGFETLVKDIVDEFGPKGHELVPVPMHDYNSDWDSLYPFSAFLTPYKVPLEIDPDYYSPWRNEQQFRLETIEHASAFGPETRNMTIKITHPGLIWTVIAFDAHVLQWTLDKNPPDHHARHFLKEASFYGVDSYSYNMVIKAPAGADEKILVNYMGLQEKGMWPAKKGVKYEGGLSMELFEKLDPWLEESSGGKIDALLMGCVAGVARV